MGGCSLEGWQGRRVFPPPVGGGTCKRVLLQEYPGPPSTRGPWGRFRHRQKIRQTAMQVCCLPLDFEMGMLLGGKTLWRGLFFKKRTLFHDDNRD
jgi:hypothetical protein